MIDFHISLGKIDWGIHFHCAVSCYHADQILSELEWLDCPGDIIVRADALMRSCRLDTGLTYSNPEQRETVIVVALTSNAAEFQNSLQHEICHCVDDICLTDNILDKEQVGYLTGEVNREIFPYIQALLCDRCRKKI